jgi:hypothetical protein
LRSTVKNGVLHRHAAEIVDGSAEAEADRD